jgi:hypothetical protein
MNLIRCTLNLLVGSIVVLTLSGTAVAQVKPSEVPPAEAKPCEAASYPNPSRRAECYEANRVIKTYYLAHVTQQNDANEILIALRNVLDMGAKLYLVASENAIVVAAPPDQQEIAQKIIGDLDRTKKIYRLTFTLTESDAGKRINVQHLSMVVEAGQRTTLKHGSKVPVITSIYNPNGEFPQNRFEYLDIGMNFDATLDDLAGGGLRLKSKVEQSSVADEHMPGPLAPQPVIRQTVREGVSTLTPGKPLTLGTLDVAGTTRHIDIQIVAEPAS